MQNMLLSYIEENWPEGDLQEDPNGLHYKIVHRGKGPSGAEAKAQSYTIHYTLWVPPSKDEPGDGKLAKVDSSHDRKEALSITPQQVVKGWALTLPQMKQGERRVLLVPSDLGYGKRGHPPVIPPNSFLLFEMETVSFQ